MQMQRAWEDAQSVDRGSGEGISGALVLKALHELQRHSQAGEEATEGAAESPVEGQGAAGAWAMLRTFCEGQLVQKPEAVRLRLERCARDAAVDGCSLGEPGEGRCTEGAHRAQVGDARLQQLRLLVMQVRGGASAQREEGSAGAL